jgi:cell shape-determining protein MreC
MEMARLKAVQTEMQTLRTQLDELDKELNFLQRVEKPEIKIQYSFGKPAHLSSEEIIHLGEFPMEMENPTKTPTIPLE